MILRLSRKRQPFFFKFGFVGENLLSLEKESSKETSKRQRYLKGKSQRFRALPCNFCLVNFSYTNSSKFFAELFYKKATVPPPRQTRIYHLPFQIFLKDRRTGFP